MNNKIWHIKDSEELLTDKELVDAIVKKVLSGDNEIKCNEMKDYIKIKDSIYQFYLEEKNENL